MNTKFKIITLSIFLISACQKDQLEPTNKNTNEPVTIGLSKKEAMDFIANIDPDSSKVLSKIQVNWDLAKNGATREGNKWTVILEGQPTYQNYKQGYRQLVILRDKRSRRTGAKILEIIPDAIYLQKNRISKAADFTGRVFEYDLNYQLTGGRLYRDGRPVGKIRQSSEAEKTDRANQMLKEVNPFYGAQGKLMKMMAIETCIWVQDSYVDAWGDLTIHSTELCSTTYVDGGGGGDGYYDGVGGGDSSGPTSGGGGGGSTGMPPPPAPSNLPGEDNNVVNPKEMMECFSKITSANAAFVVRVYVVEPQPGTAFNVGANSFGHVAISLSKTSGSTTITQTVGFYPTGSGLDKLSSKSQILDNGFDTYNISSTYYVSAESFQKVVSYLSNPPTNYHFTDFNCSAFVYGAGQAGGLPIPDPTGVIGMGFGKTPAGMARALREQKAKNPNLDINEAGGKIPESNGPCKIN